MIGAFILAALFLVLAVIFLMGKGDMLIAGYNTASEEERKQVNIHRLRLLVAVVCGYTAVFCGLMPFLDGSKRTQFTATAILIGVTFIFVILANTWARKR